MKKITPKEIIKTVNPVLINEILHDFFGRTNKTYSNTEHLKAAMEWLCRSQDESGCSGCSSKYDLIGGWNLAYPETTGYIISTFLRYADFTGDKSYIERAVKMGDWEINIQLESGAVRGGFVNSDYPIVFNTGMVILGWTDLFKITNDRRYLDAAVRASDWLCEIMDEQGRWIKFEFQELPHAYCSRVAWSLLEVHCLTAADKYKVAAKRFIDWVLSGVNENGWIQNMSFYGETEQPLTHTIAYTLRGLLECSKYFDENYRQTIRNVVINAADRIMHLYRSLGSFPNRHLHLIPGRINSEWLQASNSSCLTGNAQIAIIWMKLYLITKQQRFLDAATEVIQEQKKVHDVNHPNPGIKGGIAGSFPIWGDYCHFSYLNWATKFYADSLMLLEIINNKALKAENKKSTEKTEAGLEVTEPEFDVYLA